MDMAGFECAWQVEIDEKCRQVLERHWPGVPKYGDISEVKGSKVEPVDILCGGFPCQPVSVAGKRGGVDDERWLWDEFYRLICEIRPKWVVAENVPGLLSANSGRAFAGVLRDLAKGGYDVAWDMFPAGGPGGVGAPHQRQRIFIIGKYVENSNSRGRRREKRIGKDDLSRSKGEEPNSIIDEASKGCRTWNIESSDVADTKRIRQQGSRASRKWSSSETYGERQTDNAFTVGIEGQWSVEPNVGRVANGVPNRVDRLKALGNAVVPQVAKQIGEMIMEIESV
jgi:DNA (cytosine-5)-methyltransferase 1